MKRKKILPICMVLCLTMMFVACSKKNHDKEADPTSEQSVEDSNDKENAESPDVQEGIDRVDVPDDKEEFIQNGLTDNLADGTDDGLGDSEKGSFAGGGTGNLTDRSTYNETEGSDGGTDIEKGDGNENVPSAEVKKENQADKSDKPVKTATPSKKGGGSSTEVKNDDKGNDSSTKVDKNDNSSSTTVKPDKENEKNESDNDNDDTPSDKKTEDESKDDNKDDNNADNKDESKDESKDDNNDENIGEEAPDVVDENGVITLPFVPVD